MLEGAGGAVVGWIHEAGWGGAVVGWMHEDDGCMRMRMCDHLCMRVQVVQWLGGLMGWMGWCSSGMDA